MTFIVIAHDIMPGHSIHHYMGGGMWSSERSDAATYATRSEAESAVAGSTFAALANIIEVPDAPEEQQN